MHIARYLKCTVQFGLFYDINLLDGLEIYVDTDFVGY